jgi:hypothetical protein
MGIADVIKDVKVPLLYLIFASPCALALPTALCEFF